MVLEDFEREMAVDSISIRSLLPRLDRPDEAFCLPGTHERLEGWQPRDYHHISTPYFKDGQSSGFLRLPFRESGEYLEIEASFALLKQQHEARVRQTYAWQPLARQGGTRSLRGNEGGHSRHSHRPQAAGILLNEIRQAV